MHGQQNIKKKSRYDVLNDSKIVKLCEWVSSGSGGLCTFRLHKNKALRQSSNNCHLLRVVNLAGRQFVHLTVFHILKSTQKFRTGRNLLKPAAPTF